MSEVTFNFTSLQAIICNIILLLGHNADLQQVPPFPTGMNALPSLMMNFQSIDAVPDLNDRFVFKETNNDLQTQNGLNVFPSLPLSREPSLEGAAPIQTFKASQPPHEFFNQNQGAIFTPQERERLVGHLVGRNPSSLVLTPRQR